ncbi:MAG: 2-dehydropantoate 2-reductase [Proteobacteria bacterium]|nr:2-dehydropantoate 2-reductase [Pseudomonadota bacterium]
MEIIILGGGALGSILAAHLIEDGHQVALLARGHRAKQVRDSGLQVGGLSDLKVQCQVISEPTDVPDAELLIVTVKTYDIESAIAPLASRKFDAVFSVANGVLKNSQLAQCFDARATLGCMADTSGELLANGEVRFTRNICLHIGEYGGEQSRRVTRIAQTINHSGVKTVAENNIQTIEWSKFVGWVALLILAVTTQRETGKFLADKNCARLAVTIIHEMAAIAAAKAIKIIDQSPLPVASLAAKSIELAERQLVEIGNEWKRNAPNHRLSALQDLQRSKKLEVAETLGFAVSEAQAHGVRAPTLETCFALLNGINGLIEPAL